MNLGSHTHFYIGSCMGVGVDVLSLKDELSQEPWKNPQGRGIKGGSRAGQKGRGGVGGCELSALWELFPSTCFQSTAMRTVLQ